MKVQKLTYFYVIIYNYAKINRLIIIINQFNFSYIHAAFSS